MKPSRISSGFRLFLVFAFVTSVLSPKAFAVHIAGGEFSFATAGNGIYTITLKLYQVCGNTPICSPCPGTCAVTANVIGKSAGFFGTSLGTVPMLKTATPVAVDAISLCSSITSVCTNCGTRSPGSFTPGFEILTFQGTFNANTLPTGCCEFAVTYAGCCHQAGNLTFPTTTEYVYMETSLNRCTGAVNSSPVLNSAPVVIACSGQDFSYNPGAIDPDGDSLSYKLATALLDFNRPATYSASYNVTSPFPYLGMPYQSNGAGNTFFGMYVDSITGDVRFRPIGIFYSSFTLEITQWRTVGGVVSNVGSTRRDVDFYSVSCPTNSPPVLKTYKDSISPAATVYDFSFCTGEQTCFRIAATDFDGDSTNLQWTPPPALVQKGATFTPLYSGLKPRQDSFLFCWTPSAADVNDNKPYYMLITSYDNKCTIKGRVQRTFSIRVKDPVTAQITKRRTGCINYAFGYNRTGPKSSGTKLWSVETLPGSNTFTTYSGDSILLHTFTQHGTHRIRLTLLTTATNCETTISDTVEVPQVTSGFTGILPNPIKGDSAVCKGRVQTFYSDTISASYTYQWTLPAGWSLVSGQGTNRIDVIPGSSSGVLVVRLLDNCDISGPTAKLIPVYGDAVPANVIYGDNSPCRGSIQSYYTNVGGMQQYLWQVPPGWAITQGQGTNLMRAVPGVQSGTISVRTVMGCDTSAAAYLSVSPLYATQPVNISGDTMVCPAEFKTYSLNSTISGSSYLWQVPAGWSLQSGQGYGSIEVFTSNTGGLVKVRAVRGCDTSSFVSLTVGIQPKPVLTQSISGPDSVAAPGIACVYSVPPMSFVSSYQWQVPAGWKIQSGQGSTSISVKSDSASGIVKVKLGFACNRFDSLLKTITYKRPVVHSGLADLRGPGSFLLYPNPNQGRLMIANSIAKAGLYTVLLTTPEGRQLQSSRITIEPGSATELNLEELADGLYLVSICGEHEMWHSGFLISR